MSIPGLSNNISALLRQLRSIIIRQSKRSEDSEFRVRMALHLSRMLHWACIAISNSLSVALC
jgi:hypothetical protein